MILPFYFVVTSLVAVSAVDADEEVLFVAKVDVLLLAEEDQRISFEWDCMAYNESNIILTKLLIIQNLISKFNNLIGISSKKIRIWKASTNKI